MKKFSRLLLIPVMMAPLLATGCADRRVVVSTWGPAEQPYYVQWEHETHRQHEEWERRNRNEQREYWNWRHHHDHDHDGGHG